MTGQLRSASCDFESLPDCLGPSRVHLHLQHGGSGQHVVTHNPRGLATLTIVARAVQPRSSKAESVNIYNPAAKPYSTGVLTC